MKILELIPRLIRSGPVNIARNIQINIPRDEAVIDIAVIKMNNSEELVQKTENVLFLNYKKHCYFNWYLDHFNGTVTDRGYEIVHSHGLLSDYFCAKTKGVYKISTVHCNMFIDYPLQYGFVKGYLMAKAHAEILKSMDLVVACSETIRRDLERKGIRSIAVLNGIKPNTTGKENSNVGKKIFVTGNQFVKRKNIEVGIKGFLSSRASMDSEYWLFGDGPLLGEYRDKYRKVPNIVFHGHVSNFYDYLRQGNVYISASLYEGMPLAILEAMSMGLYVLASRIPSHEEIFEKKIEGELFNPYNEMDLAEKIDRIDQVGSERNVEIYKKHFTAEGMASRYLEIYRQSAHPREDTR